MASKSRSRTKSDNTYSGDAGDKDMLIAELKGRISALENELRSKQEGATSSGTAGRMQCEGALQDGEERLSVQADDAPVLIWANGPDGAEFVNRAYLEFLGVDGLVDIQRFDWAQYVHPDDREAYINAYLDCFRRQAPFDAVFRFRRHDGEYRWMKSTGRPRHMDGVFQGYVGSTQDITEQKIMEDELRESKDSLEEIVEHRTAELRASEVKFRAIFEEAGAAIFVADVATGRIINCNRKAEELLGRPREDIIGLHQTQLHPADHAEVQREQFARHANGIVFNNDEAMVQHRDGRVIPVIVNAATLKHNGRDIMIGFFLDITERKKAEEALQISQARLAKAQEMGRIGNWEWDIENDIDRRSEEWLKIFDHNTGVGTMDDFLNTVYPDDREYVRSSIDAAIKGLKPYNLDFRVVTGDDSPRYMHAEGEVIYNENGKPVKMFGIAQDITERKRVEKALVREKYILTKSQEVAHVGNWAWDVRAGVFTGSAENYRIYGYEQGEVKPTTEWVLSRVHTEDRAVVADFMDANVRDGKRSSIDFRIIRPDGSVVYVNTIADKAVRDKEGRVTWLYGITQDITERKRAEEDKNKLLHDLGERVKELRALHGIYDIMQKGRSVPEVLQQVTNILPPAWQYPEVTAARVTFDGQECATPDFRESSWVQRADFHTADGKHGAIEVYYLEKMPDEAEGPFLSEERDLINSLAEMLSTYLNKYYAEEALREAKQQAELYLDLMGHDINNMHQIALGYLEVARDMNPDASQGELLDKPTEVLQRSAQLIENVRKLQKLRDGVFPAQEIDACCTLVAVKSEYEAVSSKDITLRMNGHDQCFVYANELLHDVFANLVNNAVKHTGTQAEITVILDTIEKDGKRLCRVAVEDNGPGIPYDSKERIFNRIHMGSARGMGLGLYLVRTLVNRYGGRVWVEDRVHGDYTQGARFVVLLPAIEK